MNVSSRLSQVHPAAYTPADCRPLLNLGRDKIYALIRSGELRSIRVGRKYLVPADAVAEFLQGKN